MTINFDEMSKALDRADDVVRKYKYLCQLVEDSLDLKGDCHVLENEEIDRLIRVGVVDKIYKTQAERVAEKAESND